MKRPASEGLLVAFMIAGAAAYLAQLLPLTVETALPRALSRYGGLLKLTLQTFASFFAFASARAFPAQSTIRRSWLALGLGLALVAVGQALLAPFQMSGQGAPFPSLADVPFSLAYLPLFAGLFAFLRAFRGAGFPREHRVSDQALALTVVVLGVVLSAPVLSAALHGSGSAIERVLSIAYPLLGLALLVPAILIWRAVAPFQRGDAARAWLAIAVGIAWWVGADTLYAWPSEAQWIGPVSNAFYLFAYGSLALGACVQSRITRADER